MIEELFDDPMDEGLDFEDTLTMLFRSVEFLRSSVGGTCITYQTKKDWMCDPGDEEADFDKVR